MREAWKKPIGARAGSRRSSAFRWYSTSGLLCRSTCVKRDARQYIMRFAVIPLTVPRGFKAGNRPRLLTREISYAER